MGLEETRQYEPSPKDWVKWVQEILSNTEFFFAMLPLFARHQYNTQSIKVSYFDTSAMRTEHWEFNSYETFNFLEPWNFFNLTGQIHRWLRITWRQIFPINSMINQTWVLNSSIPLYPHDAVQIFSKFLRTKVRICVTVICRLNTHSQ